MAGSQKENKGTGVKTAEKKGGPQKKGEHTKQAVAGQRVAKPSGAVKTIKKDQPGEAKDEKQTKPSNNDSVQKNLTTEGKAQDAKGNQGHQESPNASSEAGENVADSKPVTKQGDNKGTTVAKPSKVASTTEKPAVPGKESKSSGPAPNSKTQKPGPENQKTKTVTQKSEAKASKHATGTPRPGGQQKPGVGTQKSAAGTQKAAAGVQKPGGGSEKSGAAATTPRGTKTTPTSGKSTPQVAKRMETSTTGVGRLSSQETTPGKKIIKPEESAKSPRNTSVSSEASVAENTEDQRRESRVSVTSSKISDMSLKLDLSSSSSGLPSFPGSAAGVHTSHCSATGSVSDPVDNKVPGIDITFSSDQDMKAGEQNDADDKVFKENNNETDNEKRKQESGKGGVEKSDKVKEKAPAAEVNKSDNKKSILEAKAVAKVENDQRNANVNSNANINTSADSKTDNSAKQVIAASDVKGKLVDGNVNRPEKPAVIVPVPVLTPNAAVDTVVKEGKERKAKNKEVKVVKETKDAQKEGKEAKSKDAKTKTVKKDPDVKDSKQKDPDVKDSKKEKDVKVVNKRDSISDTKTEQVHDKSPREAKENKRGKSWNNLFSRDSGKEAPGKAEKVEKTKKKDKKGEKWNKKESKPAPKNGISAWSRISTKELLAGAHTMNGEKQNGGVGMTNISDIGRKESMSVLTVPNSNNLDDNRQGKPDGKSLRSTGSRLSVTSARRGSMESRRSVDIRGGLLNATVINPPGDDKPKSVVASDESYIQSAIPVLPLPAAVMCLLLNILIPGMGKSTLSRGGGTSEYLSQRCRGLHNNLLKGAEVSRFPQQNHYWPRWH
jgi:hypothetical protein